MMAETFLAPNCALASAIFIFHIFDIVKLKFIFAAYRNVAETFEKHLRFGIGNGHTFQKSAQYVFFLSTSKTSSTIILPLIFSINKQKSRGSPWYAVVNTSLFFFTCWSDDKRKREWFAFIVSTLFDFFGFRTVHSVYQQDAIRLLWQGLGLLETLYLKRVDGYFFLLIPYFLPFLPEAFARDA